MIIPDLGVRHLCIRHAVPALTAERNPRAKELMVEEARKTVLRFVEVHILPLVTMDEGPDEDWGCMKNYSTEMFFLDRAALEALVKAEIARRDRGRYK